MRDDLDLLFMRKSSKALQVDLLKEPRPLWADDLMAFAFGLVAPSADVKGVVIRVSAPAALLQHPGDRAMQLVTDLCGHVHDVDGFRNVMDVADQPADSRKRQYQRGQYKDGTQEHRSWSRTVPAVRARC